LFDTQFVALAVSDVLRYRSSRRRCYRLKSRTKSITSCRSDGFARRFHLQIAISWQDWTTIALHRGQTFNWLTASTC